ncbi:hypothetical protein CVT24_009576 [Panaeolus cyanescens]|uniref:GAR domain-containing protein n=1 Tax=Panaeolus cyanescens TaxID=181874 RepID=A0A409YA62_9AGAR|nr:hypothetical protein CVT24_009576 [Panaeolus cyanescens]
MADAAMSATSNPNTEPIPVTPQEDDQLSLNHDQNNLISGNNLPTQGTEEQALELHEVIELQTFSERKAWIEDKIKFLEALPPIEVFVGLDALQDSAEDVPGLPSREQLQQWVAEHDAIEKETEMFDTGELKKLRKLTKAATQRNLSPADTDVIELTLTTIYELDKLLHLLRDRSDNLEMMGIRLTWEENRQAAWRERRQIIEDLHQFAATRARWDPIIYEASTASGPAEKPLSVASFSGDCISADAFSRTARFKLAEILSRDAALFSGRVTALQHGKITAAGKALDKLIDRKTVPEVLLDEQDRLEEKCMNDLSHLGKFTMSLVMQWRKADEIFVESLKDYNSSMSLLAEIEAASKEHPNHRQSASFLSRVDTISKRLAVRGDPSSRASLFPRPEHPLFPDQRPFNESLVKRLSSDISTTTAIVKKVEVAAKEYRVRCEAVKQVEALVQSAQDQCGILEALIAKFRTGTKAGDEDGSPPDISSEKALNVTSHSAFIALLPTLVDQALAADKAAQSTLQQAPIALLDVNIPSVDQSFKEEANASIKRLTVLKQEAIDARNAATSKVATIREARKLAVSLDNKISDFLLLRSEVIEAIARDKWQQETMSNDAPPTPESPKSPLSQSEHVPHVDLHVRLQSMEAPLPGTEQQLQAFCQTLAPSPLRSHLEQKMTRLLGLADKNRHLLSILSSVQSQKKAVSSIKERFQELMLRIEDTRNQVADATDAIADDMDGSDSCNIQFGPVITSIQEDVTVFTSDLAREVPFVSGKYPVSPRPRSSFSDDPSELPYDLVSLDNIVRTDVNSYAMRINGQLQDLIICNNTFETTKLAASIDPLLSKTTADIKDIAASLSLLKGSLGDIPRHQTETADELRNLLDQFKPLRERRTSIVRSLSPIRELLKRVDERTRDLGHHVREELYGHRNKSLADSEVQLDRWDKDVETLMREVTSALEAENRYQEELRLAQEKQRQEEERKRLAEEAERARLEEERCRKEEELRLKALKAEEERLAELERQRVLAEKLEAERLEREEAERLRQQLEAEARLQEAARRQEEEQRLAKENAEKLRLEQEKQEALKKLQATESVLENERRLHAEKARQADNLAKKQGEEMEELRRQSLELERRASERPQVIEIQVPFLSPPIQEEDPDATIMDIHDEGAANPVNGQATVSDVFGVYEAPDEALVTMSRELLDLQSKILRLRKRLRSISLNEVVRPARATSNLPSNEHFTRLAQDFAAVSAEADALPKTVEHTVVNTELRSLRTEITDSSSLLQDIEKLAAMRKSIDACDAALSDLLEHIDSFPAAPLILSSSHQSDTSSSPEEQLNARVAFCKAAVEDTTSKLADVPKDHRAVTEHSRVQQTWVELEEMANERLAGSKSRSASVISSKNSSGRNSSASTQVSTQPIPIPKRGARKVGSYSHLSVSSTGTPSSRGKMLAPPPHHATPRRAISGSSETSQSQSRSASRLSTTSTSRSVSASGPLNSSLYGSTFASRQRTASLSADNNKMTPTLSSRRSIATPSRLRNNENLRSHSPAMSETSSYTRSVGGPNRNSTSWARAPRDSFSSILPRVSTPHKKTGAPPRKKYVADPKSKLDMAVGDVVNQLEVGINVEGITETWRDQSGKYWIGNQDPKLCFCRILRSQTVMVRVGGGWTELSRFIKDHFAESFRMLPESPPRPGTKEERWISSASLLEGKETDNSTTLMQPPRTPEPTAPYVPSFSLMTPSGQSPHSIKSSPSTRGSPLTPLQFLRKADVDATLLRPVTPSKPQRSRPVNNNLAARTGVWRP